MKRLLIGLVILFAARQAAAMEATSPNLRVPGGLDTREFVLTIVHRMLGRIDDRPLDNFFGAYQGANTGLFMRYRIWSGLEAEGSFAREEREYAVNAGYTVAMNAPLKGGLAVQYYNLRRSDSEARRGGFFLQASVQTKPIFRSVRLNLEGGYDVRLKQYGLGVGLDAGVNLERGLLRGLGLVLEYSPVMGQQAGVTGPEKSFAAGVKVRTWGHQFTFLVGNNVQVGGRRWMLGAPSNDLFLGFNIQRFLKL